jgi:hypothetical protein
VSSPALLVKPQSQSVALLPPGFDGIERVQFVVLRVSSEAMKITVESTSKIVTFNGIPCRIWEGTSASRSCRLCRPPLRHPN